MSFIGSLFNRVVLSTISQSLNINLTVIDVA